MTREQAIDKAVRRISTQHFGKDGASMVLRAWLECGGPHPISAALIRFEFRRICAAHEVTRG